MSKTCLITGVGPGTGAALVRRFASGGYDVAMLARSEDRLEALNDEINTAHAYACDVSDPAFLDITYASINADLGAPSVIVHNAVGAEQGTYMDINPDGMRKAFEINTMALLQLARLATDDMIKAGGGSIICTGNTSAYRGRSRFAGFAPTKAAQRILLESIAREAGPKGIHASYVAIDAVIDLAWTREMMPDQPDEFFCKPVDIAEECYRIAHQPRSAWSFESVIRPYGETW
ncbi:MAG: short-chain dehydrogenase [Gammaproteobacteria bacterium]|nr:short-chain dehydrogenase [Gammaproteobacteria bacterium]|tara:strand:+ start:10908 stop:11606 length:699 start_codon:yes stop_codon:yes gene_type:complete